MKRGPSEQQTIHDSVFVHRPPDGAGQHDGRARADKLAEFIRPDRLLLRRRRHLRRGVFRCLRRLVVVLLLLRLLLQLVVVLLRLGMVLLLL